MSISENESNQLVSSVEKAELLAAIGREVARIDQAATSQGYTAWALWAASGVVSWKALELADKGITPAAGFAFTAIIALVMCIRTFYKVISDRMAGGPLSFRSPSTGPAEIARGMVMAALFAGALAFNLYYGPSGSIERWVPVVFLSFPMVAGLVVLVGPRLPLREGGELPRKGADRIAHLLIVAWMACGIATAVIIFLRIPAKKILPPDGDMKLGALLAVVTLLLLTITKTVKTSERRSSFQKLETELTLSRISTEEAKERYENLMLGLSVSSAVRPWIEAVSAPLDSAYSGLGEAKNLIESLRSAREARVDGVETSVEKALRLRVENLLEIVKGSVDEANRAHIRLRGMCFALFGDSEISKSPIAAEYEKLVEARRRVSDETKEIKAMLLHRRLASS